jgi:hypothetical protein
MKNFYESKKKLIFWSLIVFICIGIYSFKTQQNYLPPAINGDAHQYLTMSVNIFKHQIITHDSPLIEGTPSNYREFFYPLYISVFYLFLDWEFDYSLCILEKGNQNCELFYDIILVSQIFSLFLLLISFQSFFLKKPKIFIIFLLISLFIILQRGMLFSIGPELLSAVILLNFCIFLRKVFCYSKSKYIIISSFLFISLILIKNVFYYLIFLFLILIPFIFIINYFFKKSTHDNDIYLRFFIVTVITYIMILPYQLRNVIHFNDTALTKRGMEMLTLRNEFLKPSYKKLTEGFYYYSPNFFGYKNNKMNEIKPKSFFYENNPKSYYRGYVKKDGYTLSYVNKKFKKNYSDFDEWERYQYHEITKTNIKLYLDNIFKQSYVSAIIFFRGLNYNYDNTNDKFLSKLVLDIIVYVTTFYFLYSFFISLKKTKISEIIFLLPCFYFILMMSTLTMTEPRMNDTILIFLLYNFLTRFKKIQN